MAKFRSWPRRNLLQPGLGGSIVPWYRNDVPLPVKNGFITLLNYLTSTY
jgi:hypothetical protein